MYSSALSVQMTEELELEAVPNKACCCSFISLTENVYVENDAM